MPWVKKFLVILFASMLIGIGINGFIVPFHLIDGGVIGLSLLVKYIWHVKVGLTILVVSLPIYVMAWIYFRKYFYNSVHGLLVSSIIIDLCAPLRTVIRAPEWVSALVGGLLVGSGIGIMLRNKTPTGGADLLAQFISFKTSINVGLIIFLFDGIVILLASLVIPPEALMYSALTICAIGFTTYIWTYRMNH
ncbi:MAG TPA: YitT family protein [Bacillales bacterium]|nr:YitT family protein [Bacillales bacterium]